MKIILRVAIRIAINAAAIWLTATLLPNFTFAGNILELILVAIIFGIVNAIIRPIIILITLPINLITLGLFTLVINAGMLILTVWLSDSLRLEGGLIQSFFTAFLGAIIISIISMILSLLLVDKK